MVRGLEHCEKNLGKLGLFSLEKKQLWVNLNVVLNYIMEGNREQGDRLRGRMKGNRHKLENEKF